MAITSLITNTVPDSQKPTSGHTPVVIAPLTGEYFTAPFAHTVDATGIVDADAETAFTAVLAAVKTHVDGTFLPSTVKLDTTATITARIYVDSVQLSQASKFADAGRDYQVRGRVTWK